MKFEKCENCGSKNITIDERYNPRKRGHEYKITCRDCGYVKDGWTDY